MRVRAGVALAAFWLAALWLAGCSPTGPTSSTAATDSGPRELSDRVLARLLDPDRPGCSAAVAIEGEIAWSGARGVADLSTGAPITPGTRFDLASVSKQFTATAVLLLDLDGALALSDLLIDHLDRLPSWAGEVTIADLMHHTSGIPDYTLLFADAGIAQEDRTAHRQAVEAILAVPELDFRAGTRFAYSNSNYILLAEVVESVTGASLSAVLATRIFEPLALAMELRPGLVAADVAKSYERDAAGVGAEPLSTPWEQIGDGSIFATPTELARWGDNYRTGAVGGDGLLERQVADPVEVGDGSAYGAGIVVAANGALSHLGGWNGFSTAFGVSADRSTSIAVSCNGAGPDLTGVAEGLRLIWAS